MLTATETLSSDLGDMIERDPEVRQARRIADAARIRLVACMTGAEDGIDPAEAQRMLDAFRGALAHAEEAEDQVLVHRGLLTSVEAARRAAHRRPVTPRPVRPVRPVPTARVAGTAVRVRRKGLAGTIAGALALVVGGVALARWLGVRPPLARS